MSLTLYAHPFSSYCQKALIALYENDTPFELRLLDGSEAVNREFGALWPIRRMPLRGALMPGSSPGRRVPRERSRFIGN